MTEGKHTPLPWAVRPQKHDDWGYIRGPDGTLACIARGADDKDFDQHRRDGTNPYAANAELIVRSVNSLPALVEALWKARSRLGIVGSLAQQLNYEEASEYQALLDEIDSALAAHRGKV